MKKKNSNADIPTISFASAQEFMEAVWDKTLPLPCWVETPSGRYSAVFEADEASCLRRGKQLPRSLTE